MRTVLFAIATLLFAHHAAAQVWVDESQLKGRLPDWVDQKEYAKTLTPPRITRTWHEPQYRTVTRRIWVEPGYQVTHDRVWIEGHFETRPCPVIGPVVPDRPARVWVEGHYEIVERRTLVTPGYWRCEEVLELIRPGYWEEG